jgi:hypothetical protein
MLLSQIATVLKVDRYAPRLHDGQGRPDGRHEPLLGKTRSHTRFVRGVGGSVHRDKMGGRC